MAAQQPLQLGPYRLDGPVDNCGTTVGGQTPTQGPRRAAEAIPRSVQQLIELQLEHLSAEEQAVLAMASVGAWSLPWRVRRVQGHRRVGARRRGSENAALFRGTA